MLEQGRCGRPHYLSMTICNLTKKQGFGKLGSRVFLFFFFWFYVSRVAPGETVKPAYIGSSLLALRLTRLAGIGEQCEVLVDTYSFKLALSAQRVMFII